MSNEERMELTQDQPTGRHFQRIHTSRPVIQHDAWQDCALRGYQVHACARYLSYPSSDRPLFATSCCMQPPENETEKRWSRILHPKSQKPKHLKFLACRTKRRPQRLLRLSWSRPFKLLPKHIVHFFHWPPTTTTAGCCQIPNLQKPSGKSLLKWWLSALNCTNILTSLLLERK